MRSTRALVRLSLVAAAPPLRAAAPTIFGRWLLGRVASLCLDWPTVAFHRVEVTGRSLEVLLVAKVQVGHPALFAIIAEAIARETTLAAARQHWVRGPLWAEVEVIEAAPRVGGRSAAPSLRSG